MAAQDNSSRKVITPDAILSFPALFEPESFEGGEPKYKATFIFTEDQDLTPLKRVVAIAAKEKFGDKAKKLAQAGKLRMPFLSDDEAGYPEGSTFIRASTKNRPGVVSMIPDSNNGGKPMRIEDPDELYPGAVVRASIVAFGYDKAGNKGVSFALNNVQKVSEGERLDGRAKAEDEFDADEDAAADLSDMDAPESEGGDIEEDGDDLTDLM